MDDLEADAIVELVGKLSKAMGKRGWQFKGRGRNGGEVIVFGFEFDIKYSSWRWREGKD